MNNGPSDLPLIEKLARSANCETIEAGLSSRFRSRAKPLTGDETAEAINVYNQCRILAPASAIALTYDQALPWMPPRVDTARAATYQRRIRELKKDTAGVIKSVGDCRKAKPLRIVCRSGR